MNMPKSRITPKLGSIDELLKLSEKSNHEAEPLSLKGDIQSIPVNKIRFFKDHPFHLYEGERLADMVDSISANGILVPVIIRRIEPDETGHEYEMLSGHNRMNAALLIGLELLPSIIKEKLSNEEALCMSWRLTFFSAPLAKCCLLKKPRFCLYGIPKCSHKGSVTT